jgi:hypothetical protein
LAGIILFRNGLAPAVYYDQLAAAMIGAGIATSVSGLISFFAKPDLGAVPFGFLEALQRDISYADYYREDVVFTIKLDDSENHLVFKYTSVIRTKKENLTLEEPSVGAPEFLRIESMSYKIDGQSPGINGGIAVRDYAKEEFEVVYSIDDEFNEIKDMHLSFTALNNIIVNAIIPEDKFNVCVYALTHRGIKGRESLTFSSSTKESRIFSYKHSLFPWQGIEWVITPVNIARANQGTEQA